MSLENPLWGATRMHGELLKLGIRVARSTVSLYMVPRWGRPLQTWKTFLHNHAEGIASVDLFVVPTIAFQLLVAFVFVRAYPRETQEMVFDAHDRAFVLFKGTCRRGIYDNMKTAVETVFICAPACRFRVCPDREGITTA
jgi:hypothetical protein